MQAANGARGQRGVTLTELMVATAVSLVATVGIFQSFAASEGHRRTATSGGDASYSGGIGMYIVQRDLRIAGYGINHPALLGCNLVGWDEATVPPGPLPPSFMAPVVITQGVGTAPDRITVSYSSTNLLPAPIKLTQSLPTPAANFHVDNAFGVAAGNLLVMAQTGMDCTLSQATNTPSLEAPGKQDLIVHNSGTYKDPYGNNVTARYNKPGGTGPDYTLDAMLFNLGPAPTVNNYYIGASGLLADQTLTGILGAQVAAHIVQLQAEYGRDTNNDSIVDTWTEATPAAQADWAGVLAVRLAIVARSALPERPDPETGACATTTTMPAWIGGALDVSSDAQWRCYRYRVFEGTTSLRNMIWRPA
jgi:type IV pilus assembly protein PilW